MINMSSDEPDSWTYLLGKFFAYMVSLILGITLIVLLAFVCWWILYHVFFVFFAFLFNEMTT